jgi:hypothetical protein
MWDAPLKNKKIILGDIFGGKNGPFIGKLDLLSIF